MVDGIVKIACVTTLPKVNAPINVIRLENTSNQIKSLLLSHHHSTSALVSEILTSVLQTVQKNKTTIDIWTVHIYRVYRRQCAKYTYIYSVHTVYHKDILRYQCTNTHYTPYLHVCINLVALTKNTSWDLFIKSWHTCIALFRLWSGI